MNLFKNQKIGENEDIIFRRTLKGFSNFIKKTKPDLVIVHGDRIESLAITVSCFLNNILLAHIEGGEVSGTKDEVIRHSISKLSDFHFVSNLTSKKRLLQLGEQKKSIFMIGSPEVDIALSKKLPTFNQCRKRYNFNFKEYAIFIFHPITDQIKRLRYDIEMIIRILKKSNFNYLVIYPNNDPGSKIILNEYKKISNNDAFKIYPSLRFEFFLSFLKNAKFIIGNSSSGVREAPIFGIPTINIGSRQHNRSQAISILHCSTRNIEIVKALQEINFVPKKISKLFGDGKSAIKFEKIISNKFFWDSIKIKKFVDI